MIRIRVLAALTLVASLQLPRASDESERRYRMYRNSPKPLLTVLPVASRRLERPVQRLFDQAMDKEARKLKEYRVLPLPESVGLDSLGQLLPGALRLLRDRYRVELVLQSKLELAAGRNMLFVEMIDTRNGDIRAKFRDECRCPVGKIIAWMVPESVRRLTSAPRLKEQQDRRCEEGMASIPAPFVPGSPEPDSTGRNWGPGAFCMDLYEYPNEVSGEPTVEKSWSEADTLCAKRGKRLCTEAEWELACGGWQGNVFPYGTGYAADRCNTESATIQLSGGNAGCRSPFGVYDLSGNVYEWTASNWSSQYRDKVVKGGNWNARAENSTCKARFGQPVTSSSQAIGFRCCLTLSP